MPAVSDRRQFLHWVSAVVAASTGCYVERKKASTGTASGSVRTATLPDVAPPLGVNPVLFRATQWLWRRQLLPITEEGFELPLDGVPGPPGRDGGWHSANYATLKSGPSLTSIVLRAMHAAKFPLASCPWVWIPGEHFLREHVDADGFLGTNDGSPVEYPNYATALALPCLLRVRNPRDRSIVERMTKYLVGQQYREANGFGPEHVAYGGWGFGGKLPVGGSPGHMDLAHTRHVLEALRAAGHEDPATYRRAERFLRLVQKHPTEDREHPSLRSAAPRQRALSVSDGRSSDESASSKRKLPYDGGFYFSPVVLAANKAGEAEHEGQPYFRSYATATCEGILALLACGVKREDERIRAAVAWLEKHPRLDYPEGIPDDQHENWGVSIRYYHFAVRAQCYAALDWPGDWRRELGDELAKRQEPDGSFVNREGILMKEDDPILCTALAVLALGYAEKAEGVSRR
jgi:squalene-hopene/tetraprenyl-beta-curcumene cyclase